VVPTVFRSSRILYSFIIIAALILITGGCSLYLVQNLATLGSTPDPDTGVVMVLCTDDEVTLAWTPPLEVISTFKIYYRVHKSGSWILLDEIPSEDNPEYTLYHSDFGNGEFEFGVVAVDGSAAESEMHTSLDASAQPSSGWYLAWAM
jgi:hypothetical protein